MPALPIFFIINPNVRLTSVPPAVQTEPATIEAIQLVHDSILLGGN